MSEHVPFLKIILDRPDDLGPRLVYADWAEERGDTDLAEYVRLGCELEQSAPEERTPAEEPIQKRMARLFGANRADWLGPFAKPAGNVMLVPDESGSHVFRFACSTPHFLKRFNAEAGLPRLPHSWGFETHDLGRHLDDFLACSQLDWLSFLFPNAAGLSAEQSATLLTAEGLRNVCGLNVARGNIGDAGSRLLAGTRTLNKLDTLVIGPDPATESGLHALLDSRRLARLRRLHLYRTEMTGTAPPRLKHSSRHPRLESLTISQTHLGDSLAAWLADWPGLGSVMRLELRDARIGPRGAAALAVSPHLRRLTHLDISVNPIGDEGARTLAAAPFLGTLKSLKVNRCDIGPGGAMAFLAAAQLPAQVSIFDNPLGDARRRLARRPATFSY